mgnify:CR=1 FL=1
MHSNRRWILRVIVVLVDIPPLEIFEVSLPKSLERDLTAWLTLQSKGAEISFKLRNDCRKQLVIRSVVSFELVLIQDIVHPSLSKLVGNTWLMVNHLEELLHVDDDLALLVLALKVQLLLQLP